MLHGTIFQKTYEIVMSPMLWTEADEKPQVGLKIMRYVVLTHFIASIQFRM